MRGQFDIVTAAGDVHDRTGAWCFIRDFAAAWATPIAAGDGVTDEELDTAERRLGLRLPAAVREAYRLLGRRTDLTSANGTLLRPRELEYGRAGKVLVVRAEHQNVAFLGVSLADPVSDDPPALMYMPMLGQTHESWSPFIERFSLACVDMVLMECTEGGELSDGRFQVDGEPAALVDGLARLPYPRYLSGYEVRRWYAGSDVLVRDDGGEWVAVLGRTRQALDAYRTSHPGDWVDA